MVMIMKRCRTMPRVLATGCINDNCLRMARQGSSTEVQSRQVNTVILDFYFGLKLFCLQLLDARSLLIHHAC